MKFSALFLATLAASTTAFAPPSTRSTVSTSSATLSAATLEAPESQIDSSAPVAENNDGSAMNNVEKDWEVKNEFVKDSDRVMPGRYANKSNSIAIPFLPRPTPLDGSHAGDYGFDPLGLSEKFDLYTLQESEIRHARLAMLAVVGWPLSELLAPDWMLQEGGCAPSVLNGVNPLSFVGIVGALGALGYLEIQTALRSNDETPMGRLHKRDMSAVWKYGVAGDYNWDPLNLYSSCGDDYKGRKGLRDVEVSHGRMAMLGITYFAFWEALTGHAIVENNMLFHPNLVFPLLVGGYVAWSQIYELGPLDKYPIDVRYTNEGEMKLKRLQKGWKETTEKSEESAAKVKKIFDGLDEKYDIYEKVGDVPKKIVESVKSTYKYW